MQIAAAFFIYLTSLSMILLPERIVRPMMVAGVVAAVIGLVGTLVFFLGPKSYALAYPDHILFYGLALLCGTGMGIAYGIRKLVAYYKELRRRRSER